MAGTDYLPRQEADLVVWFQNFSSKIGGYATLLGITTAAAAAMQTDYLLMQATIQNVNLVKAELAEWVRFKEAILYGSAGDPTPPVPGSVPVALSVKPPGMIDRIRALVQYVKAHGNYSTSIGADLGIIGGGGGTEVLKPECSAKSSGDFSVTIKFKKAGHTGVEVYAQRAGETTWTLLAFDTVSPYVDNRAPLVAGQPEERRYKLKYRDNDVLVGEYSDVLTITVGP